MVPRRVVLGFFLSLTCLGGAVSARADERIDSEHRIPGRTLDVSRFPGNATVITREDIKRSGASTVQEAIADHEGVSWFDTRGYGTGSDATLNLRGVVNGSRSGVLVLVDGVPQNTVTGDEVHWQAIPVDQVERIEVIRGGGGVTYGEGALAGVINITTLQQADRPIETEVGAEYGTYGWQQYRGGFRGSAGRAGYAGHATRRLLDGYRDFSYSRNTTLTGHGRYEVAPELSLRLHGLHSEDTTAFPGGLTRAEAEQRRRQAVASRVGIFDDETDQLALDAIFNPSAETSLAVSGYLRNRVIDSKTQFGTLFTLLPSQGLNVRSSHDWESGRVRNTLVSGLELSDDKASTGTRGGDRVDESNRSAYGMYVEDTLTLWDRLTLVGGFRYDKARFEEDIIAFDSSFNEVNFIGTLRFEGKSPSIGATYAVVPDRAWLFAKFSRPFKAPNIDDFASRTPDFVGNVSLQPQQADTYETGGRWRQGPFSANATWFFLRTKDEIIFVQGIPGNPFLFQNQNFDTRRHGVEFAAHYDPEDLPIRGRFTYTSVDAEFRKGQFTGRTIPGTPEHLMNVGAGYSPLQGLWIDLDWQLVADYVRINDVSNALPAGDNYGVLNVLVRYDLPTPKRLWQSAAAYLKFENVTAEEYVSFQSSNGHTLNTGAGENPMPRFGMLAGLEFTF